MHARAQMNKGKREFRERERERERGGQDLHLPHMHACTWKRRKIGEGEEISPPHARMQRTREKVDTEGVWWKKKKKKKKRGRRRGRERKHGSQS